MKRNWRRSLAVWAGRVCGVVGVAFIGLWVVGPWYGRAAAATSDGHLAFSLNGGGASVLYHAEGDYYACIFPNGDGHMAAGLASGGPPTAKKKPRPPFTPFTCSWWTFYPADRSWLPGGAPKWTLATGVTLPLWCLGLPLCIAAALIEKRYWRSVWRERLGRCHRCGYDRAGIEGDAPCPECGKRP